MRICVLAIMLFLRNFLNTTTVLYCEKLTKVKIYLRLTIFPISINSTVLYLNPLLSQP